MHVKILKVLVLVSYVLFSLPSSYAEEWEEAVDTLTDYSQSKNIPLVLTPKASEEALRQSDEIDWMDISGIEVGYFSGQDIKPLAKKINSNIKEYNSLSRRESDFTLSLFSFKSRTSPWFDFFSSNCGVNTLSHTELEGSITIISSSKMSSDLVCRTLIYSFSVNGIELKADRKKNVLIATQKLISQK